MLRYAVIGVGINLNHASFPAELEALATSLRIEGGTSRLARESCWLRCLRSVDEEMWLADRGVSGNDATATGCWSDLLTASSWVQGQTGPRGGGRRIYWRDGRAGCSWISAGGQEMMALGVPCSRAASRA